MVERRTSLQYLALALVVLAIVGQVSDSVAFPQDDAVATLAHVKELLDGIPAKRIVTPLPGSRSVVLAATSFDLFLLFERGSIRGGAIDEFYQQLEAGDMDPAYDTFTRNNITSMRANDFGWNGLGVPWENPTGATVEDILFKVEDGLFHRVDVTAQDAADFLELLRTAIIPALEGI